MFCPPTSQPPCAVLVDAIVLCCGGVVVLRSTCYVGWSLFPRKKQKTIEGSKMKKRNDGGRVMEFFLKIILENSGANEPSFIDISARY